MRRQAVSQVAQSQPADQPDTTDIHIGDIDAAIDAGELQVVDTHNPHTIRVDDLLIQHVPHQVQIIW